jgi:hypothetical protein
MKDEGKDIKTALAYVNSFFKDVGLLFKSLDSLLAEKGFVVHPTAGNKSTFVEPLTNHIGVSTRWVMKNIQRLYVPEEAIEKKEKGIDKSTIVTFSLNPLSVFEMPMLSCGVVKYAKPYALSTIWDLWLWEEYLKIDLPKSNWRIKKRDGWDPNKDYFDLILVNHTEKDKIELFSVFLINMIQIENSTILKDRVVDPLVDLYNDKSELLKDDPLIIKPIPSRLYETWMQKEIGNNEISL